MAPCAELIAAVAMKSFLAFVMVTGGVLFIAWWRFAQPARRKGAASNAAPVAPAGRRGRLRGAA